MSIFNRWSMRMLLRSGICLVLSLSCFHLFAQSDADRTLPVRGFCIAAPVPSNVDSFTTFMYRELQPRHINTLILRVDYHYQFRSHPELTDTLALSPADVHKIVQAARECPIPLIPPLNFLWHQFFLN